MTEGTYIKWHYFSCFCHVVVGTHLSELKSRVWGDLQFPNVHTKFRENRSIGSKVESEKHSNFPLKKGK
jgi:hypothetical protein